MGRTLLLFSIRLLILISFIFSHRTTTLCIREPWIFWRHTSRLDTGHNWWQVAPRRSRRMEYPSECCNIHRSNSPSRLINLNLRFLIIEVVTKNTTIISGYYPEDPFVTPTMPFYFGLIWMNNSTSGFDIERLVNDCLDKLPKGGWPTWNVMLPFVLNVSRILYCCQCSIENLFSEYIHFCRSEITINIVRLIGLVSCAIQYELLILRLLWYRVRFPYAKFLWSSPRTVLLLL